MKKFLILMMSLMTIFFAGCGDEVTEKNSAENKNIATEKNSPPVEENKISTSSGKILVAYFSRAGDNYEVGVIEKGNTKIVAEMIAAETHADMFEIKTVKPYPADYRECTEVAKVELQENARPEIVGKVENFSDYDTIFLGYPIWWSELPMAVYTFLESYDFSGKKIIPFCTSAGNNLTGKENLIPQYAKGATIGQGIGIKGKRCQDEPDSVQKEVLQWLENLNL